MAKHWTNAQQDLFEEPPPRMRLAAVERAKLMEQLQALLKEATAAEHHPQEAGDDQDRA
jgi:hypothetical protein